MKFDIHFLGLPRNIFFGVTLTLEKCKKECNMLQIILVQDFCPLKIKITQCPDGFRLNLSFHQFLVMFTDIWIGRTGYFPVFCCGI